MGKKNYPVVAKSFGEKVIAHFKSVPLELVTHENIGTVILDVGTFNLEEKLDPSFKTLDLFLLEQYPDMKLSQYAEVKSKVVTRVIEDSDYYETATLKFEHKISLKDLEQALVTAKVIDFNEETLPINELLTTPGKKVKIK